MLYNTLIEPPRTKASGHFGRQPLGPEPVAKGAAGTCLEKGQNLKENLPKKLPNKDPTHQLFSTSFQSLTWPADSRVTEKRCLVKMYLLFSSKSPSALPGRRTVPFLPASRSISAWGETTASGPSAPTPAPGGPPASSQSPPEGSKPGARVAGPGALRGGLAVPASRPPARLGCPGAPGPPSPRTRLVSGRAAERAGRRHRGAWTLLAQLRPRPPRASGPSDASRSIRGEGPGPQEPLSPPAALAPRARRG